MVEEITDCLKGYGLHRKIQTSLEDFQKVEEWHSDDNTG